MQRALTVSDVNKYIKGIFSSDYILTDILVSGEISNYKYHYSGHMYFTLKDDNALIKAVMFKSSAETLKFTPENGMKVIIRGYVSVYEKDGQYQLYAQSMQPDGIGSLHIAFEQLKERLQKEGLFEAKFKKPIPLYSSTIGVITSSTGSVVKDIINISTRRNKNVNIKILPVQVQGQSAAASIAKAILKFNELNNVDLIIIARGGGSLEELWAFNEEIVARTVFQSQIPIISAVGHETDYTICDFVADLRAPTPSAAAELAVFDLNALELNIKSLENRLISAMHKKVDICNLKLERFAKSQVFRQPYDRIYQERIKIESFNKSMENSIKILKTKKQGQLLEYVAKLDALSPLKVMARGYSIVKDKDNKIVSKANQVNTGDVLSISLSDGEISCTVND